MISLRSKNTKAILGHMFLHEEAELYVNEMARKFSSIRVLEAVITHGPIYFRSSVSIS